MKILYKILRSLLVTCIAIAIGVPVISYLMLSTSWAQQRVRDACAQALFNLIGTEASIGKIDFSPFNKLAIYDVSILDDYGNVALKIDDIDVRLELIDLLKTHKLIIDYAVIEGLQASVYRDSLSAPLNIQSAIERFKNKESKGGDSNAKLRINSIEIIDARLAYNVLDAPATPGKFNVNHLLIDSLNADIHVPSISKDDYSIYLQRLTMREQSGFVLKDFAFDSKLLADQMQLNELKLELPESMLEFDNIDAPISSIEDLGRLFTAIPLKISLKSGSHVYLPDFQAFNPTLREWPYFIYLSGGVSGTLDNLAVDNLDFSDESDQITLDINGEVRNLPDIQKLAFSNLMIEGELHASSIEKILSLRPNIYKPLLKSFVDNAQVINLEAIANGNLKNGELQAALQSQCGQIDADVEYKLSAGNVVDLSGTIATTDVDLGSILSNSQLGLISASTDFSGTLQGNDVAGEASIDVTHFQFRDYDYQDLKFTAKKADDKIDLIADLNDKYLALDLNAKMEHDQRGYYDISLACDIQRAQLDTLNLFKAFPDHSLSTNIRMYGEFRDKITFSSFLMVDNLRYLNSAGKGLNVRQIKIGANNFDGFGAINLSSDFINGTVQGDYDLATLVPMMKDIFYNVFYDFGDYLDGESTYVLSDAYAENINNFTYEFEIKNARAPMQFFKLPISIVDPVTINGQVSAPHRYLSMTIDAPWLLQGDNKLIDNTNLIAVLDAANHDANVYFTTHLSTQKGPMSIIATFTGEKNYIDANIDWQIEREIPINGQIAFNTEVDLMPDQDYALCVNFNPGQINFGNELWNIQPATITYYDKKLTVDGFALSAPTQSIKISGTAGDSPLDVLQIDLSTINLIEIFQTLEIENAMLCGQASGRLTAASLFSKTPIIETKRLSVKDIGYNGCVFGDAEIHAELDNEDGAICFNADVLTTENRPTQIIGNINPNTNGIDMKIYADRIKVGFLQNFMKAFCSDIEGYASGYAHLFGTLSDMDMEADVYAQDIRMKIEFTNTWFTAKEDSIHIRPGRIDLKDIRLYDDYNHTAMLNGYLRHDFFHRPDFEFNISQAQDFLCYDVPKRDGEIWYGRIFGTGSAYVTGRPGVVNIGANMTTAENSTFTFELSDAEQAEEYSFITFRDATPEYMRLLRDDQVIQSSTLEIINQFKKEIDQDAPTAYNMDIQVDITPQAQVVLVMDPVGGDRIRCQGSGQLHMTYGSANNDLALYGTYTLDRGDYNFTLQDIIVKEFKIKEGSSITFNGDPYSAYLNINATYGVNANLSDLDESFLQDKELNRTNVPVNALMKVTGDMRQPDIDFDLEFPTLQQDVYRKVRSIISTEEMMNRQIIYLLALHRFYTPEYMASTTKGNELFSVASSTISSQLSSMLGKLSDNWSIAPNLRSDRGDFSDVEVDVALSSSLLNNRLLFNGNFGYRDKSLNTNQFIGDFDIEYLLNRPGTIRLKAYNRYNDQNYYLRTAQTTQGLGVTFRRDFDNFRNFFHKDKKEKTDTTTVK